MFILGIFGEVLYFASLHLKEKRYRAWIDIACSASKEKNAEAFDVMLSALAEASRCLCHPRTRAFSSIITECMCTFADTKEHLRFVQPRGGLNIQLHTLSGLDTQVSAKDFSYPRTDYLLREKDVQKEKIILLVETILKKIVGRSDKECANIIEQYAKARS
ncbi:MAG: hypothetical protein HGB03_01600 [Candidatus Yonathbacteria bacterium]|nr:hypothetical protein [Candidatus Yonathbacteria bacterium]NTW47958.1 hypothetical protein [Candidatus Yonathbacteria bacterium]